MLTVFSKAHETVEVMVQPDTVIDVRHRTQKLIATTVGGDMWREITGEERWSSEWNEGVGRIDLNEYVANKDGLLVFDLGEYDFRLTLPAQLVLTPRTVTKSLVGCGRRSWTYSPRCQCLSLATRLSLRLQTVTRVRRSMQSERTITRSG